MVSSFCLVTFLELKLNMSQEAQDCSLLSKFGSVILGALLREGQSSQLYVYRYNFWIIFGVDSDLEGFFPLAVVELPKPPENSSKYQCHVVEIKVSSVCHVNWWFN
jgi:hypothetical protein